ncbi:MAG: YdcF family protein [Sphingobacteriia bacterium]|nr:YdcF family protein [Sphingobacteriia bacterium]
MMLKKLHIKKVIGILKISIIRIIFMIGLFSSVLIALSFTSIPFYASYRLSCPHQKAYNSPDYIVVLGAGGMPSAEAIMRCYYGSEAAKAYVTSQVIIALPTLPQYFKQSHTYKMYQEMRLRGVDSTRFIFEIKGTNTHEQALTIKNDLKISANSSLLIITSPEHIYRSIKTFQRAGFKLVSGLASYENAIDESLLLKQTEKPTIIDNPGRNPALRYNMWNYLKIEITVLREYFAITWYWLNGWI